MTVNQLYANLIRQINIHDRRLYRSYEDVGKKCLILSGRLHSTMYVSKKKKRKKKNNNNTHRYEDSPPRELEVE